MRQLTYGGVPIPGLNDLVRTAIRLHPAPGEPRHDESHFGGPLLWPSDEPWPECPVTWPPDPDASDDAWAGGHPLDGPVPVMVSAAQFFRDDFPELPFPEGTDVLQILFCPMQHNSPHHQGPAVRLVWRDSGEVEDIADPPPAPEEADVDLLPAPCVFEPCSIDELPRLCDFPPETRAALGIPEDAHDDPEGWPELDQYSKIGGWTPWYTTDRHELGCRECGAELRQTIALATEEDEVGCGCDVAEAQPAGWSFARQDVLHIFTCPTDVTHPFKVRID
ncbi:hypothetical protein [Amycolatopsis sp. BJA-103]|uniref:hypothetical protein n=1 Tax=unclassified Amycolatopsis TaxID=2618356 RepID=UPI000C77AEA4|nr:hypothetical protein [Amycolatopsis sp. BJA-103]AUI61303.1 hypothetical protein BKN51_26080 [Amycolatopsis sp. BJA-103]PNE21405.1 hypothetical protein B1H26_06380 [Amycolatopsis sp. BJA-103]